MPMISIVVSRADIIDDHVPDGFDTVRLLEQRVRERGGDDIWNVLMLGYGSHLGLIEAAEGDAIVPRDHDAPPSGLRAGPR